MAGEDLWLGDRVPRLLQALRDAGMQVVAFKAEPATFGSWYVDVARGVSVLRVVADGKEQWIVVQAPLLGEWQDLHTWRAVTGADWIDAVIQTINDH
jgi:hypothetical protein